MTEQERNDLEIERDHYLDEAKHKLYKNRLSEASSLLNQALQLSLLLAINAGNEQRFINEGVIQREIYGCITDIAVQEKEDIQTRLSLYSQLVDMDGFLCTLAEQMGMDYPVPLKDIIEDFYNYAVTLYENGQHQRAEEEILIGHVFNLEPKDTSYDEEFIKRATWEELKEKLESEIRRRKQEYEDFSYNPTA